MWSRWTGGPYQSYYESDYSEWFFLGDITLDQAEALQLQAKVKAALQKGIFAKRKSKTKGKGKGKGITVFFFYAQPLRATETQSASLLYL